MASLLPLRESQLSLIHDVLHDTQKYNACYTPQAKILIELHLQQILTRYSTLSAAYEDYTYNDGRTIGMIKLTGTIPIFFSNNKYNIPVAFWITERYPQQPPIVYVVPTQNMIIKEYHDFVDSCGVVQTPYFRHWHPERSDLVGLVADMAQVFGVQPPLYAKMARPANPYHPPTQQQYQPQASNQSSQMFPAVSNPRPDVVMQTGSEPGGGFHAPEGHSPQPAMGQGVNGVADLNVVNKQYRETVMTALTDRVMASLQSMEEATKPKVVKQEEMYNILRQRGLDIEAGILSLQEERQIYEHNVQVMALLVGEMTEWRSKVQIPEGSEDNEIRAEDVIVPQDPLTAQFLRAQAEDLAAEDALNVLDQMLQREVIDLETYLKQIRKLCRIQYFARALTMKMRPSPGAH